MDGPSPGPDAPGASIALTPTAFTADDGAVITVWQNGHQPGRPHLHWAHANGFHGRAYTPLFAALDARFNLSAWDMRGHGQSRAAAALAPLKRWDRYYRDLAQWLATQPEPVWLAGHSVGAVVSLRAAGMHPHRVRGLLLVEPVMMGRRRNLMLAVASALGQGHRVAIAAAAAARRAVFADRDVAFANYRAKPVFATFSDAWLRAYVDGGFIDRDDGQVTLACTPDWEAQTFAATDHRALRRVTDPGCPVRVLAGTRFSTFHADAARSLRAQLADVDATLIEGASHFLPMEYPDQVVELLGALAGTRQAVTHPASSARVGNG